LKQKRKVVVAVAVIIIVDSFFEYFNLIGKPNTQVTPLGRKPPVDHPASSRVVRIDHSVSWPDVVKGD